MRFLADFKKGRRLIAAADEHTSFGLDKLNVPRSSVPAITHVDYSSCIQTLHRETNPRYHAVITKFKEKIVCPLVMSTSFNVRGKLVVFTPVNSLKCFIGTELDVVAIGSFLLPKKICEDLYETD